MIKKKKLKPSYFDFFFFWFSHRRRNQIAMGATETKMISYEEAKNRLGILFYTLESNFKRFVNNRESGVILQNEFCDLIYESIPSMV